MYIHIYTHIYACTHTHTHEKNMEEYQNTHHMLMLVFLRETELEVEGKLMIVSLYTSVLLFECLQ